MRKEAWGFQVWKQFSHKLYHQALNRDDIEGNGLPEFYESVQEIQDNEALTRVIYPEDQRQCIRLDKGNNKYLLPIKFADQFPILPSETFPCMIKPSDKRIFQFITQPTILSITGDHFNETFKQFLDNWNPLEHSHPEYATLLKMFVFAANYKGTKACLCSEPATGKNSNFTILNHITRDVCRIMKPTLAKFETVLYYNKTVLPDEITSMSKTDISLIEPSIMVVGDASTEMNKHSMAKNKRLNEIDLAHKSLIFTYNRKQDLNNEDMFFDNKWAGIEAFRERYPQLLLKGKVLEKMPNLSVAQAREIMEDNFNDMRKVAKQVVYWGRYMHMNLHGWARKGINLPGRHVCNLEAVFDVMDVYSHSQEEFDKWVSLLLSCISDYRKMLCNETIPDRCNTIEIQGQKVELKDPEYSEPIKIEEERPEPFKQFETEPKVEEEVVVQSDKDRMLQYIKDRGECDIEEAKADTGLPEDLIADLMKEGEIFEMRPGIVRYLE